MQVMISNKYTGHGKNGARNKETRTAVAVANDCNERDKWADVRVTPLKCSPRQRQDKDEKSFLGANLFRKVIPSSASSPLMVAAKGKEQGYYCFRLDGWLVGGNCYGRWILDTFLPPCGPASQHLFVGSGGWKRNQFHG